MIGFQPTQTWTVYLESYDRFDDILEIPAGAFRRRGSGPLWIEKSLDPVRNSGRFLGGRTFLPRWYFR